jgi:hypothetical protein
VGGQKAKFQKKIQRQTQKDKTRMGATAAIWVLSFLFFEFC